MCETCGCGEPEHDHDHDHEHGHTHDHNHEHPHAHGLAESGRKIILQKDILQANNLMAERNRGYFEARDIFALNLVSAPGSGKTTILERTVMEKAVKLPLFVIEGDQQGDRDSERIRQAGAPSHQINTGMGCHLDAAMVNTILKPAGLKDHSILFIENVGNLVCPSLFDLGERKRVLITSVTEGEDKPVKYPHMFRSSHLCLINKTDLLPYVDFDIAKFKEYARAINPDLEFIELSAKTGAGIQHWYDWLNKGGSF